MRAIKRFAARAKGGISPIEATKRENAVLAMAPSRELPPSLIAERLNNVIPIAAAPDVAERVEVAEAALATEASGVTQAILPCASNQKPIVTITIEGLPGSGKSALTHVILTALAIEGIVTTGPDDLRPMRWRGRGGAVDHLIDRGLSVVIVKRETAIAENAEAAE